MKSNENEISECAFDNNTEIGKICSGDAGIKYMKKMIEKETGKSANNENEKEIFDEAKILTKCDKESCVIANKKFINIIDKSEIENIKKKFKPHGPRDSKEWLSNFNIDNVIKQWTYVYPGFIHIPFQMRDFQKQQTELAMIDLAKEFRNGAKSFAVVINTDNSSGPGIHWFCIYGDFNNGNDKVIEYFNSSGSMPLNEIHEWLIKTVKKMNDSGINANYKIVSRNEIQKSDSECGVFVLFYIFARLNDISSSKFSELGVISDEDMYRFRKYVFREYK